MTPSLVLLPGMDGTGRLFGRVCQCLQGRFPCTPVAHPSERPVPRTELLERVAAQLPATGDYVLIAESFSGPLAIEYAASKPERLRAVVLVASFAVNPLPRGLGWLRVFAWLARVPLPRPLIRGLLVGRDASSDLVREVQDAVDSVKAEVLADRLRQVFDVDVRQQLASIEVPVLYLSGREDRLVGSRGLAQLRGRVPRLTSDEIDGPHLLLQARPQECAEAIERFLDSVTSTQGPR